MADNLPGRSRLVGAGKPLTRPQWRKRVKEREALDLWTQGKSDVQIKNALGCKSADEARELRVAGADRWMEEEGFAVNQWRAAMASDMMEARSILLEAMRGGDQMAIDRLDKVWQRMAKLLGTDAQTEKSGGVNIVIEGAGRFRAADRETVIEADID